MLRLRAIDASEATRLSQLGILGPFGRYAGDMENGHAGDLFVDTKARAILALEDFEIRGGGGRTVKGL